MFYAYTMINPITICEHAIAKYQAIGYIIFQFLKYSSPDHVFLDQPNFDITGSLSLDNLPMKTPQVTMTPPFPSHSMPPSSHTPVAQL